MHLKEIDENSAENAPAENAAAENAPSTQI